ncbi:flowering locus K homology domain-like isoform X2 [Andrographis paniculata]|uniref:flowering locus K homology domain-like isoform X2 n=1 Tax=Andrographis paniculata TaxID=175694 RepID=UPI0021E7E627|nr:flowering locus K homology domain-like isoform X2 [Andrographis paniculata]XP_051142326.1 flowering locus K homology domain-like isoform X2 [Andrographis paniculata]XP_051142327.1 flowering locus K homology domain-like isoform X2 [Andrographis paniculata]
METGKQVIIRYSFYQQMEEKDEKDLENAQDVQETDCPPEESYNPEEVQGDENATVSVKKAKCGGWPGQTVFRMLVHYQRIGGIMGSRGECIKKLRHESKSQIEILDDLLGTIERAVMIYATEVPGLSLSPALDGLIKLHEHIIDQVTNTASPLGGTVCTKILVAGGQAFNLIGKHGDTIKSIRHDSNSTIRVLGGEHLPPFALPDDSVVEIQGEPSNVKMAVALIGAHLRKFVVDESIFQVLIDRMRERNTLANLPKRGYQYGNYLPPPDAPPLDQSTHLSQPNYGRDVTMGAHTSNVDPQRAVITKVIENIPIPLTYADAVIGLNRVQAAQQLVQNSLAEAMNRQNAAPLPIPVYNPYAPHDPNFHSSTANPPPWPAGHSAPPPVPGYNPYAPRDPNFHFSTANPPPWPTDQSSSYGAGYWP